MKVTWQIVFEDKGEAARWLANYYCRAGSVPQEVRRAMDHGFEFYRAMPGVDSRLIEAEALRLLQATKDGCQTDNHGGWPAATERIVEDGLPMPMCYDCAARHDRERKAREG